MKKQPTFKAEDWLILSLFAVALVGFLYSVR